MNTRRITAIKLMQDLQPFLQSGILPPKKAQEITVGYVQGRLELLRGLIYSPDIPMQYNGLVKRLQNYINQEE